MKYFKLGTDRGIRFLLMSLNCLSDLVFAQSWNLTTSWYVFTPSGQRGEWYEKYSLDSISHFTLNCGRVTHIGVSKLIIIGSDNGLSPGQHQAIIWTNAGILSIGPLAIHFSEMLIEIFIFSSEKMHLKLSSGNWRPFCLDLKMLAETWRCWFYSPLLYFSQNRYSLRSMLTHSQAIETVSKIVGLQ